MKRAFLLLAGLLLLALLALATPSQASLDGRCSAHLEMVGGGGTYNLALRDELEFLELDAYHYSFEAEFPVRDYGIVVMGPLKEYGLAKGTSEGNGTSVNGTFDMWDLKGIAVGKYLVHVSVGGPTEADWCRGTLTAEVVGAPLNTVVGGGSAAVLAGTSAAAVAAFFKSLGVLAG